MQIGKEEGEDWMRQLEGDARVGRKAWMAPPSLLGVIGKGAAKKRRYRAVRVLVPALREIREIQGRVKRRDRLHAARHARMAAVALQFPPRMGRA